ncbi:hypothetical protein BDR03DRAFT_952984 [Suillus americanus]|nr:hypothetical protein BDR03DRAFT_952984 [Suillus americanus]
MPSAFHVCPTRATTLFCPGCPAPSPLAGVVFIPPGFIYIITPWDLHNVYHHTS